MYMDIKRQAPFVVIAFCILVAMASRTITWDPLRSFSTNMESTVGILLNFSIVVGVIMQLWFHSRNISARRPNAWSYSIATIITFLIFCIFAAAWGGTGSVNYQALYKGTLIPAHWAAEGFLVFLFFSATYRGYRARSIESFFMVVLAVISLIACGPATRAIFGESLQLTPIYDWLNSYLSSGVNRGLLMTTMVGSVAFMVRVLIGKQRIMSE
jgi:asparagine N-glycosylation enzyme membrane subunit Stt3